MKKLITIMFALVLAAILLTCTSCISETCATGVAVLAGTAKIMDDTNNDAVAIVTAVKEKTAELNETYRDMVDLKDEIVIVSPETIGAIEDMKDMKDDPVTWVALASILANAFLGGNAVGKKKRTD